jgi:hypothetical protein
MIGFDGAHLEDFKSILFHRGITAFKRLGKQSERLKSLSPQPMPVFQSPRLTFEWDSTA